jgi:integrase
MYCQTNRVVLLAQEPVFRGAVRKAKLSMQQEPGRQPAAATTSEISRVIAAKSSTVTGVALILAWVSCARISDVLQLKRGEVEILGEHIKFSFNRGKGVIFRGPYTVNSLIKEPWRAQVVAWLDGMRATDMIFHANSKAHRLSFGSKLVKDMREVTGNWKLEQKSVRRGSLQALAAMGATDDTMMLFSGHTKVSTLKQYLGWGKVGAHQERVQHAAADVALAPAL